MISIENCVIGTRVRIVDVYDYDDPMGINWIMERFHGQFATVTGRGRNSNGHFVELDIDRGRFKWTSSMLEPMAINKGRYSKVMLEGIKSSIAFKDIGEAKPTPTPFKPADTRAMEYLSTWGEPPREGMFIRRRD